MGRCKTWTLDHGLDRWLDWTVGRNYGAACAFVYIGVYVAAGQAGPPTRLRVTITSLRVALHAMIAETTVPWSGRKR